MRNFIAALIAFVACGKQVELPTIPPAPDPTAAEGDTTAAEGDTTAAAGDTTAAAGATTAAEGDTATTADGWRRFAPAHEGFSVEVPADPQREVKPVKGKGGHDTQLIQYNVTLDEYALVFSASPLIAQLIEHGDSDLALDKALASQTDVPGRTLRYKKPLTPDKGKGREAEVEMEIEGQSARLRIRLYLVETRMYQVLAIWPTVAGADVLAAIDRYYASFQLNDDGSAVGAAIDLWQEHAVAELGLVTLLPKKPEVEVMTAETLWGETAITSASAVTSFPVSLYTIEVVTLPEATAKKTDAELLVEWREARKKLGQAGDGPEVAGHEEAEMLAQKGATLSVKLEAEGETKNGFMRAVVLREPAPARFVIATVWAEDAAELPGLAQRFFAGLKVGR